MNQPIHVDRQGQVAYVTLNRPDCGNAINADLAESLGRAVAAIAEDRDARVLVLSGAGRLFCAGGDIRAFAEGENASDAINAITSRLHPAMETLLALQKPIVTLVNGPAAGAGLGLALCGDIVLAASSAHFTSAYTAIGLTPDGGTSWLLPRLIGLRRAQEMLITNRRISAKEAAEIGLVTDVVEPEDLKRAGQELSQRLAQGAIHACASARRLLLEGLTRPFGEQLRKEAELIAAMSLKPEGVAGISSFLDGSKPSFT